MGCLPSPGCRAVAGAFFIHPSEGLRLPAVIMLTLWSLRPLQKRPAMNRWPENQSVILSRYGSVSSCVRVVVVVSAGVVVVVVVVVSAGVVVVVVVVSVGLVTSSTVIVQVAVFPPSLLFTVMTAVPGPFAVTRPLLLTVATSLLELDQVTESSIASDGDIVARNCKVSPVFSVPEVLFSFTEVTWVQLLC